MQRWEKRLAALGPVFPFDYPYMKERRRAPDRVPTLVAAHREAVLEAQRQHGADRPVVLVGKSMGSRVGCHLAVELAKARVGDREAGTALAPAALVCFGYPLRAAGSGSLRDQVLRELRTPVLFLQGTRDPLCALPELEGLRTELTAPTELYVVEGGDHSLEVRRRRTAVSAEPSQVASQEARQEARQDDWDGRVLDAIARFLRARGLTVGPS
jgi:hypothetical protein